ncbi:50S ribosomal protein L16 [Candidatus Woesearchaeota archaeon]|nr:50S ribosomal protein L16 [Candidatus Woesearchaeota archaeon]
MAGLRKGKCYTKVIRAYTRKSKYKKWAFIKAIPPLKLVKFDQGDLQKKFESEVNLYSKQDIQLRHNALESARQVIHKHLADLLGNNYHLKVRPYPHHILREHKMLAGAGADRMSPGMTMAFGKPVGLAAQVKKDQPIITVMVDTKDILSAKTALNFAIARLPGKYYIN